MSVVFPRGPAPVRANLTPLIDVTFLLIVFFALVSQIADTERIELQLPQPADSASAIAPDGSRVIVSLVSDEVTGAVTGYRLGALPFAADDAGRAALVSRMATFYGSNPDLAVRVRADGTASYPSVYEALQVITDAAREAELSDARVHLAIEQPRSAP